MPSRKGCGHCLPSYNGKEKSRLELGMGGAKVISGEGRGSRPDPGDSDVAPATGLLLTSPSFSLVSKHVPTTRPLYLLAQEWRSLSFSTILVR